MQGGRASGRARGRARNRKGCCIPEHENKPRPRTRQTKAGRRAGEMAPLTDDAQGVRVYECSGGCLLNPTPSTHPRHTP